MVSKEFPYNPAILVLVTYSELKTLKYMYTHIYSALLTIARRWKQLKWILMDEWINTMLYIHTMQYYLVTERNKVLIHTTT